MAVLLRQTEKSSFLCRPTALKYLQKLLTRIIRKTPDKDNASRLCASPLARVLKLPLLFKLKIQLTRLRFYPVNTTRLQFHLFRRFFLSLRLNPSSAF